MATRATSRDAGCETGAITAIVLLFIICVVSAFVLVRLWRQRRSIVGQRGFGPGADIGRLHDVPRVRVESLTVEGEDRTRVLLLPAGDEDQELASEPRIGTNALLALDERDPEFRILQGWQQHGSVLGMVEPSARLIRLRSLDDLQPVTLRRLD